MAGVPVTSPVPVMVRDALGCAWSLEIAVRAWAARRGWRLARPGSSGTRTGRILLPGVPVAEAG
jgi:hypothetical protein